MNIGLIVYSRTGHTLSVAEKLAEALSAAGHTAALEQVEATGRPRPGVTDLPLDAAPPIEGYEALVFCAPTWGGTPASPMASYLAQLPSLEGAPVACLVTGFFPPGWGRNQALAKMQETCEGKGATVRGAASVGWLSLRRKRQTAKVVDELASLF